ncbi:hypothetical protein KAX08_00515 [candidate division WOR-3 bacterium]|nr:hypothetical protein [candidate division WOR-3 bacterium]
MSGLVGIYSKSILKSINPDKLLRSMAREITYIDTDVVETWNDSTFAVTRVHHNIINTEPQPIFNEDKSLCISMDGEVFGYEKDKKQLINRGHRFKFEDNDAEFCLHLYEEYGNDAFRKLNGSFLIAIYKINSEELILVNDRLSSRHVFYYHNEDKLIFASQLRPILKFQWFKKELNLESVFEFFLFQKILNNRTYYKGSKRLSKATILYFRDDELVTEQYWNMEYNIGNYPKKYYVEALHDTLIKATERRTRGNHRMGILLSGGLDSRIILAADEKNKIKTAFTLGDFENREVRIAKKVANTTGCRHIFLKRDLDHYFRMVDEAVDIGDGMYTFEHAHFIGFSNNFLKYCDILFAGFGFNVYLRGVGIQNCVFSLLGKSVPLPIPLKIMDLKKDLYKLSRKIQTSTLSLHPERIFHTKYLINYEDIERKAVSQLFSKISLPGNGSLLDYLMLSSNSDYTSYLNYLSVQSKMEIRLLTMDNDLLELTLSIPPEFRMNGLVFKNALKKMSPQLASIIDGGANLPVDIHPWQVWFIEEIRRLTNRVGFQHKEKLPHPTFTNKSWPDWNKFISYNKNMKELIWSTINDKECLNPEIFNIEGIRDIFYRHIKNKDNSYILLYLLLTFGRWYKKYGS